MNDAFKKLDEATTALWDTLVDQRVFLFVIYCEVVIIALVMHYLGMA